MVANPCNPDYRVVKQAETLAAVGYEVRIFCTWKRGFGIPITEVLNGVTYVRRLWNPAQIVRQLLTGIKIYPEIPDRHREKL